MELIITQEALQEFAGYLIREEKSPATQEKYCHTAECFAAYAAGRTITKELVLTISRSCSTRTTPKPV